MTLEQKKERNDNILLEYVELERRGFRNPASLLADKYNLARTTIWRAVNEATKRAYKDKLNNKNA